MDDILLFSTKDVDTRSLLDDCYLPPLKLESAGSGTFLETSFAITSGNRITHWQNNDNEVGKEPKIWRYRVALFVPSTSGAFLFVNPFHKHNEALV